MNINELLKGVDCTCGRRHECVIDSVIIEKAAIDRLSELCKDYSSILLVADENTYRAAGASALKVIGDRKARALVFPSTPLLIPDEAAIKKIKESLCGAEVIVGVGSGVIQDLCKYVSHFERIPYMIVATAPSMDGYASTGAAMILKGMKETVPCGLPKAIICDTEILKDAPMEMIKAGYGDIVGKYSALSDWRISQIINGEYLCEYIYGITMEAIEKTLAVAEKLLDRDEVSVGTLTEALIVVGIMMSFAGNSRPASGSEHHLSHFFEIVGIVKNQPYLPHGIDVAYSTVITSEIREALLNTSFDRPLYRIPRNEYEATIRELYGCVGDGCIALQDKVGNYEKDRTHVYKEKEKEIKAALALVPGAKDIEQILGRVGLDMKEFYSVYGKEKINDAIKYAKDLKDRYTVLWTAYDLEIADKAN